MRYLDVEKLGEGFLIIQSNENPDNKIIRKAIQEFKTNVLREQEKSSSIPVISEIKDYLKCTWFKIGSYDYGEK